MELRIINPTEQMEALQQLLHQAGLSFPDTAGTAHFWIGLTLGNRLIACAAIEPHEKDALLRSVAVAGEFRDKGYGNALVKAAVLLARLKKLHTLYLFTERATGFFSRNAFETIDRQQLPASIALSRQAVMNSGEQATAMKLTLSEDSPLILVLCTGNSCRSQMAHGYLAHFLGRHAAVYSAGIETHGVNPDAISIMLEDGLDISHHSSNLVTEYGHLNFELMLSVCDHAKEHCPWMPGDSLRLHRNFSDPSKATGSKEARHQAFTFTRNEVREYCRNLVQALGVSL